ncbi:hypothetical protein BFU36_12300 [Sulfolobus sp. A20]|nr:hypothetical protein BFU36_12300 [Sulfolobus sp. A20]TRM74436.1 hypothetical protein DJ528_10385 [Sulfolobus sp. B5]TRM80437.1 hypothetical protein DJ531_12275 [Sulfolobus sp. A20-N-F6]TRM81572.1 hypothetical protein DJ524_03615 [Sulfolobus sp. D5]TRM86551.1 hypothetical protein DJ521_05315 [Sulfolobus sp. E3]TRM87514.1 hypothetical protein DJ529_08210 [Sulfolobus sp. C3]TRM96187.1 hypothetical protein DMP16_07475 [Sulfolobus sp. B1]TRM99568.1 hypothetical protein DJ527_08495 [Sulfolobus 
MKPKPLTSHALNSLAVSMVVHNTLNFLKLKHSRIKIYTNSVKPFMTGRWSEIVWMGLMKIIFH